MAETREQARRRISELLWNGGLMSIRGHERALDEYAALAVSAREAELRKQIEARRKDAWDYADATEAMDWVLSLLPAPPQETGGPKG